MSVKLEVTHLRRPFLIKLAENYVFLEGEIPRTPTPILVTLPMGSSSIEHGFLITIIVA